MLVWHRSSHLVIDHRKQISQKCWTTYCFKRVLMCKFCSFMCDKIRVNYKTLILLCQKQYILFSSICLCVVPTAMQRPVGNKEAASTKILWGKKGAVCVCVCVCVYTSFLTLCAINMQTHLCCKCCVLIFSVCTCQCTSVMCVLCVWLSIIIIGFHHNSCSMLLAGRLVGNPG